MGNIIIKPGTTSPDQSEQELIRAPENKFNLNADYSLSSADGSTYTQAGATPTISAVNSSHGRFNSNSMS